MSERFRPRHERRHEADNELNKHNEALRETIEKKGEAARHDHAENIGEIRSRIEEAARSKHEHVPQKHDKEEAGPVQINRELKDMAYRRTLRRTQSKLPLPARTFSKLVHNPAVEAASEVASKTVARPSGVLAGGFFAFLGSSLFLWVTRHYGYEYNYLLFAMFFVGGFFVGLGVELGLRLSSRRSRR